MENQGETWSSYDDYYENFDTHCDQFEGNEDLYHAYDPAALDWSGEVALFDDGFALTIPVIDWYDPATQVTADDIWGDLEDGAEADPWLAPPELVASVGFGDFAEEFTTHGTPLQDLAVWREQDHPYSCAVASTSMILQTYGVECTEQQMADIFTETGIYDPEAGTAPSQIDETLNAVFEKQGMALQARELNGFTIEDLEGLLDGGVRPLIALDAIETLPGAESSALMEFLGIPEAGHAVQLTGIVEAADGTKSVVLNDPGRPDGAGLSIPLETFMNACDDFGNLAVVVEPTGATNAVATA